MEPLYIIASFQHCSVGVARKVSVCTFSPHLRQHLVAIVKMLHHSQPLFSSPPLSLPLSPPLPPFQTGLGSSLPPPSLLSPHSKLHLSGALAEHLIPQAALSCQHRGSPQPRVSHVHSLMMAYNSRLCTPSL